MNRRNFLQLSLISLAAAVLPRNQLQQHWPNFDPTCEYGVSISYTGRYSDLKHNSLAINLLHESAKKILPKNEYYEIRFQVPELYGRAKYLCWYRRPDMARRLFETPHLDKSGGYFFFGSYLA